MNIKKADNLACPIDGNRLVQHNKQLVCDSGHSFDIARQGYVNLLPVQHKRSKQPGDSKAMVLARTRFLDTGIYAPVAKKLTKLVSTLITGNKDTCLMDAGCGEGYYFNALVKHLEAKQDDNNVSFIGLDISKEAIIQATKRNKNISWIVGTNRHPPVEDQTVDIILCLFGFFSAEGFTQALKPGGKIILVDPGEQHLKELREIIYPEIKKPGKLNKPGQLNKLGQLNKTPVEINGFSALASENLQFITTVPNNELVNQLLIMTPHFYRASKAGRELACKLDAMDITVDVFFSVYEIR